MSKLNLPHGTTPVPFDNNFRKHNCVDCISRNSKEKHVFPRREPTARPEGIGCPHRIVENMSSRDYRKYVLTYIGPYRALYRALFGALFGCPIFHCGLPYFPLWIAKEATDGQWKMHSSVDCQRGNGWPTDCQRGNGTTTKQRIEKGPTRANKRLLILRAAHKGKIGPKIGP